MWVKQIYHNTWNLQVIHIVYKHVNFALAPKSHMFPNENGQMTSPIPVTPERVELTSQVTFQCEDWVFSWPPWSFQCFKASPGTFHSNRKPCSTKGGLKWQWQVTVQCEDWVFSWPSLSFQCFKASPGMFHSNRKPWSPQEGLKVWDASGIEWYISCARLICPKAWSDREWLWHQVAVFCSNTARDKTPHLSAISASSAKRASISQLQSAHTAFNSLTSVLRSQGSAQQPLNPFWCVELCLSWIC